MPGNKLVKIVAVSAIALIGGLISCSLEPSTDSSIVKTASLPAGLPAELAVYEPRVTFDGTTTTLTYNVRADFSGWTGEESKIVYTAQKTAATAANADPQSVEALLWYYGETGETGASGLFDTSAGVVATTGYPLKSTEPLPRYVIIPLDTSLIKEYLLKKYPGAADFPNLVWIEENPAIGKVETENGAWADGKYEGADLRISGLARSDSGVVFAGTIDNFDDGGNVDPEKTATRIPSIATVLADGYNQKTRYTSTINFYVGVFADSILKNLAGDDAKWTNADAAKLWMKDNDNKPALRIVYRWAD